MYSHKLLQDLDITIDYRKSRYIIEFGVGYVKFCKFILCQHSTSNQRLRTVKIIKSIKDIPYTIIQLFKEYSKNNSIYNGFVANEVQFIVNDRIQHILFDIKYCLTPSLHKKTLLGSCTSKIEGSFSGMQTKYPTKRRITKYHYGLYLFLNNDMTFSLFRFYLNHKSMEIDMEITFELNDLAKIGSDNRRSSDYVFDSEEHILLKHGGWIVCCINQNFRQAPLGKFIRDIIWRNTRITNGPASIILSYIDF